MSKGQKAGDVIKNYYPPVIDEATYFKAQQEFQSRGNKNSGGKKGKLFTNLFTGMCRCVECEDTFRLISHHKARNVYLICSKNYASAGCQCSKRWRYRFVERAALILLQDKIDWTTVYGSSDDGKEAIENELVILQEKVSEAEQRKERFASLFGNASDALLEDARIRYENAATEVSALKKAIGKTEAELQTYMPASNAVQKMYQAFSEHEDNPTYERRSAINLLLKNAGFKLWFNQTGVFWQLKDQFGILLDAENEDRDVIAIDDIAAVIKSRAARESLEEIIEGLKGKWRITNLCG